MATWTNPSKTINAGDAALNTDWNTYVRDNTQYLHDSGLYLITSQVLGASAASISLASIPATFRHLLILWQLRGDQASTQNLLMQFNGDSAANYDCEVLQAQAGAAAGIENLGGSSFLRVGRVPGTGAPSGACAGGQIWIQNYSGTTFNKNFTSNMNSRETAVSGGTFFEAAGGQWRNSSAITSVTIFPSAGNLLTGSVFSLIGVNG